MSRRGWSKPSYKHHSRGRPQNLRGKDIGLYYRNLQLQKGDQHVMVNLTVPPAVLSRLHRNIDSIIKVAEECHINLPPPKPLNVVAINPENDSKGQLDLNETAFSPPKNNPIASHKPSTSSNYSGFDVAIEVPEQTSHSSKMPSALSGAGDYKYGYQDIITGTFEEKLEECLSKVVEKDATDILNSSLHDNYIEMINGKNYKRLMKFREILPTYKKSQEILEVINNNQVVVISGETGCGKSTQIPQIILDDAILNKRGAEIHILVTQPRRIAASSLAIRVAQERSESVGESIGYAVRLETVPARSNGSIMFCTTGILLAELETNQGLTKYSHVILDEVHERDCHIDLSMMMLKQVLRKRQDLKLILMSATIDAEKLTSYFDNCPMMHIEGLAYPVQDVYLEDILHMTNYTLPPQMESKQNIKIWQRSKMKKQAAAMEIDIQYKASIAPWLESVKRTISRDVYLTLQDSRIEDINIDLIYKLLVHICKGEPGAILVFLPGISDITKLLKQIGDSTFFVKSRYEIYPLHSKLPSLEQHKIFEKPPPNVRKIIIATNIAETSITIDDIVYVVDCGKIKYNGLNIEDNISTLRTEWVAQANLRQRRGRAGRCQPGICYHLVTSYRATQLDERLLPEIQRNSLLEPVLALKRLRLGKAEDAMKLMPSPPAESTVRRAVNQLSQIGALDSEEKLTPLGWHLARLPVHPAAGKLLLLGTMFGCLNRAASVAAVWGFKDPFQLVIGKEKEADAAKRSLALGESSDHVAISEALIQFEQHRSYQERRQFAYDHFLALNTLQLLSDMKQQLGDNLKQMGFLQSADVRSAWENRNHHNISLFKALVAASLYPNIATARCKTSNSQRNPGQQRIKARTPEDGPINIHPSSVLATKVYPGRGINEGPVFSRPGANWLVYWLKQRSTELYLIDVTMIYTMPFLFFGELVVTEAQDPTCYCISISTVKVTCNKTAMDLLWRMRTLLDQVLASKIGNSSIYSTQHSPFDNQVLNAVTDLITAEDEHSCYIHDDNDYSDSDHHEFNQRRQWRGRGRR